MAATVVDSLATKAHQDPGISRRRSSPGQVRAPPQWPPWKWKGRRTATHRRSGWGASLCWYDAALAPQWPHPFACGSTAPAANRERWERAMTSVQNHDPVAGMAGCVPEGLMQLAFDLPRSGVAPDSGRFWEQRDAFRKKLADLAFKAADDIWQARRRATCETRNHVRQLRDIIFADEVRKGRRGRAGPILGTVTWASGALDRQLGFRPTKRRRMLRVDPALPSPPTSDEATSDVQVPRRGGRSRNPR